MSLAGVAAKAGPFLILGDNSWVRIYAPLLIFIEKQVYDIVMVKTNIQIIDEGLIH